jgi:fructuronate reductase/mannitol 2-dehydrogenase
LTLLDRGLDPYFAEPAPLLDALVATGGSNVALPSYDRGALLPSVVHIGVGGFHRAHQALYFDDLATTGETGWGVVGVGLNRPEMGEVLREQYGLFTVVERAPDGDRARLVGSIVRYLFAPEDPEAVLQALADPVMQLVTLTLTGAGYLVDADGEFRSDDPSVVHDLQHPLRPRTMPGYLVEALQRRRAAGTGPMTVLSCDNLPDSGRAARTAVTSFARLRDPQLAEWIDTHVSFPSSMVDRITPETSPELRDELYRRFGLPDRWPVVTEPFRQWVVEDDFCARRPPLERVGVRFVEDVTPYKLVKARVLNAGHSALGYLGALRGHPDTKEAMADPTVRRLVEQMLREEVLPLLPATDGIDHDAYLRDTLRRFDNPAMADSLARLCRRGSVKMPSYLLPSLREAREQGRPYSLLAVAVAAWLRYLRGTDLAGRTIEIEDPLADRLHALARSAGDDPRPLLNQYEIFGGLGDDDELVAEIASALQALSRQDLPVATTGRPMAESVA